MFCPPATPFPDRGIRDSNHRAPGHNCRTNTEPPPWCATGPSPRPSTAQTTPSQAAAHRRMNHRFAAENTGQGICRKANGPVDPRGANEDWLGFNDINKKPSRQRKGFGFSGCRAFKVGRTARFSPVRCGWRPPRSPQRRSCRSCPGGRCTGKGACLPPPPRVSRSPSR